MSDHHQLRVFSALCNQLGEGPVWSIREGGLYWVDILGQTLHFKRPGGQIECWKLPEKPSAVVERYQGGLLLALSRRIVGFDPDKGEVATLALLDEDRPNNRTNDAKCDPWGNFWVGTMDDGEECRSGRLYCWSARGELHLIEENIGIPNTLAWDRKRNRFYFGDSMVGEIYVYDIKMDKGVPWPSNKRLFCERDTPDWAPDGSAIDADGAIWNAQWDAKRIVKYNPDGDMEHSIRLPVSRPTSVAFGGERFSTLYITTASIGSRPSAEPGALDGQQTALPGNVLSVDLSVAGLPADLYGQSN